LKTPDLTEDELAAFLKEGNWIAKLATHNPDGTIRMTPLWYEATDNGIRFNTWEATDAARNLQRDPRASVLIDSFSFPYRGVHFTGRGEVDDEESPVDEIAEMFAPYRGGYDAALEYAKMLADAGKRVFVRFRPHSTVTWDFSKM
jgi:PPOX class probable F420-dependent enzyme